MANNASALKRQKQSEIRNTRNKSCKSSINTAVKKVVASIEGNDKDSAAALCKKAVSQLDSAVNKGILHRKTASRRVSRLTKQLNGITS